MKSTARTNPPASSLNPTNLLFAEASAHLASRDPQGAEAAIEPILQKDPTNENLLATATQLYMAYGYYTNALAAIDRQLKISPTNLVALVNKGYSCLQVEAFEQAIPPLTKLWPC